MNRSTYFLLIFVGLGVALLPKTAFAVGEQGYFYQQEARTAERSSCEIIFSKLEQNQSIDDMIGELIYNLKYINIHYLLEDYDDATRPGAQKRYVNKDDLELEVMTNKRDIYCRVELAMHLSKQPQTVVLGIEDFIEDAVEKIDATYQSAQKSFDKKDYERALFAFDLIAPYKNADQKHLETAKILAPAVKVATKPKPKTRMKESVSTADVAESPRQPQQPTPTPTSEAGQELTTETPTAVASQPSPKETLSSAENLGPISQAVLAGKMVENSALGPISKAVQRL
jgi:hypothetical protein